ncbi:PAS domain S-box protein [Chryseobacterium wanjuense]
MEGTKLLRAIIETAIDGIITIDSKGKIESLNPSALKIFGYKEEELIGKNISVLMPEPDKSRHDGYLHRYQNTGEKNNRKGERSKRTEERWISVPLQAGCK